MQIKRDIGELDEMGGILLHFCLSLRKYSLQINRSKISSHSCNSKPVNLVNPLTTPILNLYRVKPIHPVATIAKKTRDLLKFYRRCIFGIERSIIAKISEH